MGKIKEDFRYKVIKNILSKDEIKICSDYFRIKHRFNKNEFDLLQKNTYDTYFYGDPLTESFLLNKKNIIETNAGLELLPTYSFWRMYTHNSNLEAHKDRESCEISCTIFAQGDGTKWPIFIEGQPIELQPGDGLIYLGIEDKHWRENFKGDWHAQFFLHYVDKNGKYKEFYKDKRTLYGGPKV